MITLTSMISWNHVHPVFVHFTTALLPVSLASDILGKFTKYDSLTPASWWMLFFGAIATPLTALAGWLWSADIAGMSTGSNSTMSIHKWLGLSLVIGFGLLAIWRGRSFLRRDEPGFLYLGFAAAVTAALMYQGYL